MCLICCHGWCCVFIFILKESTLSQLVSSNHATLFFVLCFDGFRIALHCDIIIYHFVWLLPQTFASSSPKIEDFFVKPCICIYSCTFIRLMCSMCESTWSHLQLLKTVRYISSSPGAAVLGTLPRGKAAMKTNEGFVVWYDAAHAKRCHQNACRYFCNFGQGPARSTAVQSSHPARDVAVGREALFCQKCFAGINIINCTENLCMINFTEKLCLTIWKEAHKFQIWIESQS